MQISRLVALLRQHYDFLPDAEILIEIDPREIELDMLYYLRSEGFNQLSMGMQDFNKQVQQRINRD